MSENSSNRSKPDAREKAQDDVNDFIFSKGPIVSAVVLGAISVWFVVGLFWPGA